MGVATASGNSMIPSIRIEPHPYGRAVHIVSAHIQDSRDVLFEMELGADDICAPRIHIGARQQIDNGGKDGRDA